MVTETIRLASALFSSRFPNAKAVANPNVVKVMRQNASPEALAGIWKPAFPDQIPEKLVIAEELKGNVINLEGHQLVAVELGHTDTDFTTCLHVPSIGLVVAGDAAYNDVHLYLAESNAQTRREWIAALDTIESLNPRAVVASHKRPEHDDHPRIIEQTRQYIRDFDRLAEATTSTQELYDTMLELYPNRVNPGWALWSSASSQVRYGSSQDLETNACNASSLGEGSQRCRLQRPIAVRRADAVPPREGETYTYRRIGGGIRRPLVCLQHFTGTLDNWDPSVTDPLASDREVILFDGAGVGRSTGTVPTTVAGMAMHALDFIDALCLPAVTCSDSRSAEWWRSKWHSTAPRASTG